MPSWFKKTFGFDPLQPAKEVYEHGKEEIGRFVGDVGRQIDRSAQDVYDVARWTHAAPFTWLYQTQKTQQHRMADYQSQLTGLMSQLTTEMPRKKADYSIFEALERARRLSSMRSRMSQGILTSPLGVTSPFGTTRKTLLGA